jgi:quercetin dioxygenase-like cupin family protein
MPLIKLDQITEREMAPGYRARFVHSDNMSFSILKVTAGATLPTHSHPHEQVSTISKGRFELTVDGEPWILEPGIVGIVPPNAQHSGRALTECEIMDAFYPVREDFK